VVDGSSLENWRTRKGIGGSNPSSSAIYLPNFGDLGRILAAYGRQLVSVEEAGTIVGIHHHRGWFSRAYVNVFLHSRSLLIRPDSFPSVETLISAVLLSEFVQRRPPERRLL
jgi:hypothetical protein